MVPSTQLYQYWAPSLVGEFKSWGVGMVDEEDERVLHALLVLRLRLHGGVGATAESLAAAEVTVERWHTLAHAAASELRRPVRTFAHRDSVWAQLEDWPANELEETLHRAQLGRAPEAATLLSALDERVDNADVAHLFSSRGDGAGSDREAGRNE